MKNDAHLTALAREYLGYIRALQAPDLSPEEREHLNAHRTLAHNALIEALGPEYDRPFNMQTWCRTYFLNFFLQQSQNQRPDAWRKLAE